MDGGGAAGGDGERSDDEWAAVLERALLRQCGAAIEALLLEADESAHYGVPVDLQLLADGTAAGTHTSATACARARVLPVLSDARVSQTMPPWPSSCWSGTSACCRCCRARCWMRSGAYSPSTSRRHTCGSSGWRTRASGTCQAGRSSASPT